MGYLGAIFILAGVFTAIDAKSTVMELITGKSVAEVTFKKIAENPLSCPDMLPLLKIQ